jgi:hypothetical protein
VGAVVSRNEKSPGEIIIVDCNNSYYTIRYISCFLPVLTTNMSLSNTP